MSLSKICLIGLLVFASGVASGADSMGIGGAGLDPQLVQAYMTYQQQSQQYRQYYQSAQQGGMYPGWGNGNQGTGMPQGPTGCAVPDPTENISSVTIIVRGSDDYQSAGSLSEAEIKKDCQAYAEDEARREAMKVCAQRGGILKMESPGSLQSRLVENFGTQIDVHNRKCQVETAALFSCVSSSALAPSGGAEVAEPVLKSLERRAARSWDASVNRSKHSYSSRIEQAVEDSQDYEDDLKPKVLTREELREQKKRERAERDKQRADMERRNYEFEQQQRQMEYENSQRRVDQIKQREHQDAQKKRQEWERFKKAAPGTKSEKSESAPEPYNNADGDGGNSATPSGGYPTGGYVPETPTGGGMYGGTRGTF